MEVSHKVRRGPRLRRRQVRPTGSLFFVLFIYFVLLTNVYVTGFSYSFVGLAMNMMNDLICPAAAQFICVAGPLLDKLLSIACVTVSSHAKTLSSDCLESYAGTLIRSDSTLP